MSGESDLRVLLRSMRPGLAEGAFVFCVVNEAQAQELAGQAWGLFREAEGTMLILPEETARAAGLAVEERWALITLRVHSALTAVGFLAAVSRALAEERISLNAVSAYYHDHLFVPWGRREAALAALERLSGENRAETGAGKAT